MKKTQTVYKGWGFFVMLFVNFHLGAIFSFLNPTLQIPESKTNKYLFKEPEVPKKVVPEKKIPVPKIPEPEVVPKEPEPVVVPEPEAAPEEPEPLPEKGKSQH